MNVCNSIDVAGASGGQCLHGLGAAAKLGLTLSDARRPCPKNGVCTGEPVDSVEKLDRHIMTLYVNYS